MSSPQSIYANMVTNTMLPLSGCTVSRAIILSSRPHKHEKMLMIERTFVPDHPNRNAASFATNSPKPSISPLINGSSRFIAAPRIRPQIVGGLYRIRGVDEEDGGDGDDSSLFAS